MKDVDSNALMMATMRCIVALAAALVVFLQPIPPELQGLTYGCLAGYGLYSVALAAAAYRGRRLIALRAQHWLDALFYAGLLWLTSSTAAILFFLFPILAASFSGGLREGLAVTAVSALLLLAVGVPAPAALALLVFGCLIAYWGGREISLRRRLRLLNEVGSVANPRLGVDHAVTQKLRRLLAFFDAEVCVLVCAKAGAAHFAMYRVDNSGRSAGHAPKPLTEQAAQALLDLPAALAVAWNPRRPSRSCPAVQCRRLANLLETACFVTVPYRQRESAPGRLYLTANKRSFGEADAEFLRQAVDQIVAAVDNLMLLEELMENATQLERSRISRDIHDTAVQPYIGLKLALEALYRKLEPESLAAIQVRELLEMSALAVGDLRGYVARLRGREDGWAGEHLVSALREHIGRYRSYYGIEVELRGDAAVQLTERVAAEAYQIVSEALSNVHRHTAAKCASVELRCEADALVIRISNERAPGPATPFTPRSIAERAAALGGTIAVHIGSDAQDSVEVTIPL